MNKSEIIHSARRVGMSIISTTGIYKIWRCEFIKRKQNE
jgi:predicted ThiF/HesA family dinucleotide-utilizing enzyme